MEQDRASPLRPGPVWSEQLLFPAEAPARGTDVIQAIRLELPKDETPVFGLHVHWIISYFIISMVAALLIKPLLKVRL